MEPVKFNILLELIDNLKSSNEGLKQAAMQAQLQSWTERLEAFGNLKGETKRVRNLAEYGVRVTGGLTEAIKRLVPNLEKTKTLLELIEKIGDLEEFKSDLALLQDSIHNWNERARTHKELADRGFARKLALFEELVHTVGSLTGV